MMNRVSRCLFSVITYAMAVCSFAPISCGRLHADDSSPLRFALVKGMESAGFTEVGSADGYGNGRTYGFEPGGSGVLFSVAVPEGNYRVTIEFGNASRPSVNTVKAESRRLMLEGVKTEPGRYVTGIFVVNTRTPRLPPPEKNAPGGDRVQLNEREQGSLDWDEKLTLELNGAAPAVRTIVIERVAVPTVYLIGDSTVTDQPREPAASWGQMISRFFKPDVAVANHAESGETLKSFISGLRLAKVLSELKAGDWLIIQFGHNDSKKQWPQTYAEPHSTYPAYLRATIAEARWRGATPVLVTSMQRRNFDERGRIINSHGDYPEAVRTVAREEGVACVDLDAMSREFYEALGPETAPIAFADGGRDKTHHSNYGAYELARCVIEGLRRSRVDLASHVVCDIPTFDPSHPDPADTFNISPSPGPLMTERPRGN